ncbi:MAG TPA: FAD-binding and (Fe-S)-binding domain-containing protein [Polyangiaceae bacterium]|jgi:FAD/FMN-containing dehydrogenase/Fe-S oxidoreductase
MTVHLVTLREQKETRRFERERREEPDLAIDTRKLEKALAEAVAGEVRFSDGDRALYATDASNYRQPPIGVVIPKSEDDVVRGIEVCRRFGAPIVSRGGGTSLAGQSCNHAVVFDMSKYFNEVVEIDAARRLARVRPGCVLDVLRDQTRKQGLTFGPDPATHSRCTVGGMLGNNSCGTHSLLAVKNGFGMRTSDNTHELEVLTYDGVRIHVGPTSPEMLEQIIREGGRRSEIYRRMKSIADRYGNLIRERYPKLPRRVSGYNLDELLPEHGFHVARALVGTESTCVTILEATLALVPEPKKRSLVVLGYDDMLTACEDLCFIREHHPTACEAMDDLLLEWDKKKGVQPDALSLIPEGKGWLFVEFGGESKEDSDGQALALVAALKKRRPSVRTKLFDKEEEEEKIWKVREGGLGSTAWVEGQPDTWPGWEDSAVPVENVGSYLRDLRELMDKHDLHPSLYGHFGQGCIHCRIGFDLYTKPGVDDFHRFVSEASDLVTRHGGSLSGEHGDGQARAEFLPKMYGAELMEAMREFKRAWDPEHKMNPGKVIDPYAITTHLRIGPDYDPPQPETHFQYPDDKHAFSRAALRCVGVGACRDHGGQTMCPSYMVTREEKHSTRGRARVLWEMMNGDVLEDGWKSEHVKDALDLCLSCKGCKHDCPVNVDMATYKSEFLSHYYEGRLRPRHAYAFAYIHFWARLVHAVPTLPALVNLVGRAPGLSSIAKLAAGMAQQRKIPQFAPVRFKRSFARRRPRTAKGKEVILFADTFNDFFHPDIAHAAAAVLERAGFDVVVPKQDMCCGRPFYDYGMLDQAKRHLRRVIAVLRPALEQGTPIVVLEPSCAAVFRDELVNLFPNDRAAKRLREQVVSLGEFLEKHDVALPELPRAALVHGHCHQKALDKFEPDKKVLAKMKIDAKAPDDGCCGMAGSFGFEPGEHYDVSVKCGERVLLPEVRKVSDETLILADGFSCRTQIEQETDRRALHLAQIVDLAQSGGLHQTGRAEATVERRRKRAHRRAETRALVALGAVCAAALATTLTIGRK